MFREKIDRPKSARRRRTRTVCARVAVQLLENRTMMSSVVSSEISSGISPEISPGILSGPVASVDLEYRPYRPVAAGSGGASPANSGPPLSPQQVQQFYGVNQVSFGATTGNGAGQTIALIEGYNCSSVTSDLAQFDSTFGLQAPPSFVIENEYGNTSSASLPTTYNQSAAVETSLDVEWAHAMAPQANIVVIDCNSYSDGDLIGTGVPTANAIPGVSVVSMSFYGAEFTGETSDDQFFTKTGVTYLASAGDLGAAQTGYPAFSPDVIAVGGTTLTLADGSGDYGSETVWNDPPPAAAPGATGGGISTYESKPAYQTAVTQSSKKRTVPDVSFAASPNTDGVALFFGGSEYYAGGTSLGAPSWAGIIAITDQGRALAGESSLTGSTQTLPALYNLPSGDFHDITTGNNAYNGTSGYNASTGYDLASGIGTPVANKLIPDLAGFVTVTGQVFQDNTASGVYGGTDTPIPGVTVYLDENNSGTYQSTDPTAVTNASGGFLFADVPSGVTGAVRLLNAVPGYVQVANAGYTGTVGLTSVANIALFPTAYTDATTNDAWTVRVSPSSATTTQILVDGTVDFSAPVSLLPSLSFTFTGTGDSLAVDFGNGNPIAGGPLSFNGSAASNGDTLTVLGTAANAAITVNAGSVVFNSGTIDFTDVANLIVEPRTGTDSLTVNAGTVNLPAQNAGGGILSRSFSTLAIAAGATVQVGTAAAHTDRTVLQVGTLTVTGTGQLNLGGNDMIVTGGTLAATNAMVATGYGYGFWTGPGIASSVAAADPTHLTALGVIQNNQSGSPLFYGSKTFDGIIPAVSAILVKFTTVGDANLDGKVDGSDYSLIDSGYGSHGTLTGWYHGDFNYDGTVDGTDYSLIDNAFNNQTTAYPSAVVASVVPTAPAQPAVQTAVQPAAVSPPPPRAAAPAMPMAVALFNPEPTMPEKRHTPNRPRLELDEGPGSASNG